MKSRRRGEAEDTREIICAGFGAETPGNLLLDPCASNRPFSGIVGMRCCREFCKSMRLDGKNDCVIEHRFARAKENTRLRVIRFALDNGDEEIIVTNLLDTSLSVQDFKALYHLRWSIETSYSNLKNKLEYTLSILYTKHALFATM